MSDVDALRDRLIAERLTARTAEILAAVARVEYYNRQYNAGARTVDALTCPPALAMLTPADLAAWVPEATLKVRFEAAKRVADTVAAIYAAGAPSAWPPAGDWSPVLLATLDPRLDGARVVNDLAASWLFGEEDHAGPVGVRSGVDGDGCTCCAWTAPPVGGWQRPWPTRSRPWWPPGKRRNR